MKEKKAGVSNGLRNRSSDRRILIVIAIVASMIFKNPIRSERKINYKINFRRNSSDCCFYSCNVDLQGKKK